MITNMLRRIEDLLVQGGFTPVPRKIARAIQIIVSIGFASEPQPDGSFRSVRRVREVLGVRGVRKTETGHEYSFESAVPHDGQGNGASS